MEDSERLAVVSGDTHLTKHAWVKHPTLCDDAYIAFEAIISYCIQWEVPLVLLGDIFDTQRPDSETLQRFCRQMSAMQHHGLPVYFIQGNHDYASPPWPWVHEWPSRAHRNPFRLGLLKCCGIDYTPRDKLQEELDLVPEGTDVLLMHQAWAEMQTIGATDGSFQQIKNVRCLLTGDYHVHNIYQGMIEGGTRQIPVVSPGSICMQALNESPTKAAYCLGATAAGVLIFEDLRLPTRPFAHLEVKWPGQLAEVERFLLQQRAQAAPQSLPPEIRQPLVRISFADNIPDAHQRLVAACGNDFHLFAEPQSADSEQVTVTVGDAAAQGDAAFDTLETGLNEMRAQNAIDEPTYNAAVALLRTTKADLPQAPVRLFDELRIASHPAVAAAEVQG
jgi:predicted phosphodiesterase